ncbi:hypothetical protein C8J57DRAFT_1220333 [Mycena rebaudengoi]|nr:hypothetical protein C8J57DRAFT_1220333 [Mycena rebaudengoi]
MRKHKRIAANQHLKSTAKPQTFWSAMRRHGRMVIATEFITQYRTDKTLFISTYPEANEGLSKLLAAVNAARVARGDRIPGNHIPLQAASHRRGGSVTPAQMERSTLPHPLFTPTTLDKSRIKAPPRNPHMPIASSKRHRVLVVS